MLFYINVFICFFVFYGCYRLGLAFAKANLPKERKEYNWSQTKVKDAVFEEIEESALKEEPKDKDSLRLPALTSYKRIL